jgi:hypothetical protein
VESTEVDAVVSPSGEVVVSPEAVRHLALVPGQHVRVAVKAKPSRRNMRGALAGRFPEVTLEEMARVSREAWGDLATDP